MPNSCREFVNIFPRCQILQCCQRSRYRRLHCIPTIGVALELSVKLPTFSSISAASSMRTMSSLSSATSELTHSLFCERDCCCGDVSEFCSDSFICASVSSLRKFCMSLISHSVSFCMCSNSSSSRQSYTRVMMICFSKCNATSVGQSCSSAS